MRDLVQKHNIITDQINLNVIGLGIISDDNLHLIVKVRENGYYDTISFTQFGIAQKGYNIPLRIFDKSKVVMFKEDESLAEVKQDIHKFKNYLKELGYE